jgi:hypothetical protein
MDNENRDKKYREISAFTEISRNSKYCKLHQFRKNYYEILRNFIHLYKLYKCLYRKVHYFDIAFGVVMEKQFVVIIVESILFMDLFFGREVITANLRIHCGYFHL